MLQSRQDSWNFLHALSTREYNGLHNIFNQFAGNDTHEFLSKIEQKAKKKGYIQVFI